MYALVNSRLFNGHHFETGRAVIVSGGRISQIIDESDLSATIPLIDLNGATLTAGFIDLQLNGCGGVQFNDTTENISIATLQQMQTTNQKFGCCSFLPTVITATDALLQHAIAVMREYKKLHHHQALGLHIEGPYISLAKKGTHDPQLIRKPTKQMLDLFCKNADVITKVTLAPEEVADTDIQQLVAAGIIVSIGHSNANYQQAQHAFQAGASFSTHLYNAMPVIAGRDPGLIGAVLDTPEIYAGVIADGYHVAWPTLRFTKQLKRDKLILVTDATAAAGSEIKTFLFAGKTIYHREGRCVDAEGTLSGSALTMIKAVQNSVEQMDISLAEALRMASLYPARAINREQQLGSIAVGKIANLTAFNEVYQTTFTMVNGKPIDLERSL